MEHLPTKYVTDAEYHDQLKTEREPIKARAGAIAVVADNTAKAEAAWRDVVN
jgi:hypothetical protein